MPIVSGRVEPGFERVRDVFAAQVAQGVELGVGFAAVLRGAVVVDLIGGWADRAQTIPWSPATLTPVYSTTKPIAALVLAMLVDRGALEWDQPVAAVWPEFAAHGKDRVTIAEALSHQAGVPGFLEPIDPALWLDPPALAAALAAIEPLWPPGEAHGYHPLTYGFIAGELVRRATGRSLGAILHEDICAPHGIDFWIGLPDAEHARCADIARPKDLPQLGPLNDAKRAAFLTRWAAPDRGGAAWRRAEIPSANGHGTALSVAQLYGMLNDGRLGDAQILSDAAIAALHARRADGDDLVLPFRIDWRTGVMGNSNGFYGPNAETLGHSGWGGSCGFADREAQLSAAYVMNKQSNHLMGDPRARALIDALYACL
ncbi:MAG: serine hydrolase domain-containing protein [Hyphomonadaceae bacterium]|nr:serine hydrolase domain-containing protein [Hyphomonadaceae bacterium]